SSSLSPGTLNPMPRSASSARSRSTISFLTGFSGHLMPPLSLSYELSNTSMMTLTYGEPGVAGLMTRPVTKASALTFLPSQARLPARAGLATPRRRPASRAPAATAIRARTSVDGFRFMVSPSPSGLAHIQLHATRSAVTESADEKGGQDSTADYFAPLSACQR